MKAISRLTAIIAVILIGILNCRADDVFCALGDGNTLEVNSIFIAPERNKVKVSIGNDSEKFVNFTLQVEVTYSSNSANKTMIYTLKDMAEPQKSNTFDIDIYSAHPDNNNCKASSVKAISISGKKCQ